MSLEDILENIYFTAAYDYLKKRGITIEKFLKFVESLKKENIDVLFIVRPDFSDSKSSENTNRLVKGLLYIKDSKIWKNGRNIFIGYEENTENNETHCYVIFTTKSLSKTKKESRGLRILPNGNILFFIIRYETEKTKNTQNDLYLKISTVEEGNSIYIKVEEIIIRNSDNVINTYTIGICNSNEIRKCNTKIINYRALNLDDIKNIRDILLKLENLTLRNGKDVIFDTETYKYLDRLLSLLEKISKKTICGIPIIRIFYLPLKQEIDFLRDVYLKSLTNREIQPFYIM